MEKYKNKYRIKSARHPNWDYGSSAFYFVTICTHNRQHFFGEVQNKVMVLNEIGVIVKNEWLQTFQMRPDMNLYMGNFVIMPNHFHAIIGIGLNAYNTPDRCAMHCTSAPNTFGPQSKNLASIIRGFKSAVTKNAKQIDIHFKWQSRYHDHIIRNEQSFQRISDYIENNPKKWNEDTYH